MKSLKFLWIGLFLSLAGCASVFTVTSDPIEAEVSFQNPMTLDKKPLGKTPLKMTTGELKAIIGEVATSGQFFNVMVEKKGFVPRTFAIPATRFGTLVTALDVKMKKGEAAQEARLAKDILDHIFLAQKLAISGQYERAQIEIDKVLADFPAFPRALSMRASIYFAQKNYSESLRWYEATLKADPQMEDVVKMAAKVRALAGGRLPASSAAPLAPSPGGSP